MKITRNSQDAEDKPNKNGFRSSRWTWQQKTPENGLKNSSETMYLGRQKTNIKPRTPTRFLEKALKINNLSKQHSKQSLEPPVYHCFPRFAMVNTKNIPYMGKSPSSPQYPNLLPSFHSRAPNQAPQRSLNRTIPRSPAMGILVAWYAICIPSSQKPSISAEIYHACHP